MPPEHKSLKEEQRNSCVMWQYGSIATQGPKNATLSIFTDIV